MRSLFLVHSGQSRAFYLRLLMHYNDVEGVWHPAVKMALSRDPVRLNSGKSVSCIGEMNRFWLGTALSKDGNAGSRHSYRLRDQLRIHTRPDLPASTNHASRETNVGSSHPTVIGSHQCNVPVRSTCLRSLGKAAS